MCCERLQAFFQNVRLRPAMRFSKEQELAVGLRGPYGAETNVMAFSRILQTILRPNQRRQFLRFREIRRDDQYHLILGPGDGLRLPPQPAQFPLTAVVFQGNDDRKQWCGHKLNRIDRDPSACLRDAPCVYPKPKPGHICDEVRQGSRVNLLIRSAERGARPAHPWFNDQCVLMSLQ
jgi:hypothetical protein